MSDAALTRLLGDICRGGKAEAFRADPGGTIAAYGLPSDLERALLSGDYRYLLEHGSHPVLTMYFARLQGVTPFEYLELVRSGRPGGATVTDPVAPGAGAARGAGSS